MIVFNSKSRKKILLNLIAAAVPMIIGCSFYLLFGRNILFFKYFNFLYVKPVHFGSVSNAVPSVFRNYLCDICWSFSLECAVYLFLVKDKQNLILSVIVSSFISITIEMLQGLNIISGTFDFADIIVEIIAIIAAGYILKNIWEDKT